MMLVPICMSVCCRSAQSSQWEAGACPYYPKAVCSKIFRLLMLYVYVNCWTMLVASQVFDKLVSCFSWNAVTAAYSGHSHGEEAYKVYLCMQQGVKLNTMTVHSICLYEHPHQAHLVDQGHEYLLSSVKTTSLHLHSTWMSSGVHQ